MTELLCILNDQVEALQNLYKQDVEIGRHFSTTGYRNSTFYGVTLNNKLIRCQTWIVEDFRNDPDIHDKYNFRIDIKENFDFDGKTFMDKDFNEVLPSQIINDVIVYEETMKEAFIRALQVEHFDKTYFKKDVMYLSNPEGGIKYDGIITTAVIPLFSQIFSI